MSAASDFKEYLVGDVLGHIDGITSKAMFGGFGLYLNGVIFAMITDDDAVCFKADAALAAEYKAAGAEQFTYTGHTSKKPTSMPYWRVPETILEDRETVSDWVARSAALSKPKK